MKKGISIFWKTSTSLLAILLGLLLGFIILLIANPSQSITGVWYLISSGWNRNVYSITDLMYSIIPILMTGLSVGIAMKAGLFNIGGPGQFVIGGLAAIFVGVRLTFLPDCIHWLIAILVACLATWLFKHSFVWRTGHQWNCHQHAGSSHFSLHHEPDTWKENFIFS